MYRLLDKDIEIDRQIYTDGQRTLYIDGQIDKDREHLNMSIEIYSDGQKKIYRCITKIIIGMDVDKCTDSQRCKRTKR